MNFRVREASEKVGMGTIKKFTPNPQNMGIVESQDRINYGNHPVFKK